MRRIQDGLEMVKFMGGVVKEELIDNSEYRKRLVKLALLSVVAGSCIGDIIDELRKQFKGE